MDEIMAQIRVEPKVLHTTSDKLHQRSENILQAIESVDQVIRSLDLNAFDGNLATSLRGRYNRLRDKLLHWPTLLSRFSLDLESAANLFEKADKTIKPIPLEKVKKSKVLQPSTTFGDLNKKSPTEAETKVVQQQNNSTPSQPPADSGDKWWLDVPVQYQKNLKFNGATTDYGCVPTATSMVLDYWHNKNPNYGTLSAQDLINTNVAQGQFKATGMTPSDIHDEVTKLGYTKAEDYTNSDLGSLKDAVSQGPVIAIVKLGIKSTGTNHAVVVTGISPDNQVKINDPWDGTSHTYSWDVFSKSWGANFGPGMPKNTFTVIRP
jgi:uncharacterized protein YukE